MILQVEKNLLDKILLCKNVVVADVDGYLFAETSASIDSKFDSCNPILLYILKLHIM